MKKENLEEFAYKAIMKLIVTNHFQPGEFLLETEITDLLHLNSRTPVHYALGQLVAKGFLDRKKKKGCFIPLPSPEDAKDVFFVRENIESQSARSAAINASDEEIEKLGAIIADEATIRQSGDLATYASINENFHAYVATISKNRYLQHFSEYIFWRSNSYVFLNHYRFKMKIKGDEFKDSPSQHLKIYDAIKDRNPEKASELMLNHVRCTYDGI